MRRNLFAIGGLGVGRLGVAISVIAVLGLMLAAGPSQARTRVVYWSPFSDTGMALRAGLIATPKYGGDCWTGSSVVHGAYRCASGNDIYDPCFADAVYEDAVVCAREPFSTHVIRLRTDRMNGSYSAREGTVWAIRLASGLKCSFLQGASNADDAGRRLNYACNGSRSVLWGNPIRRGSTWHIRLTRAANPYTERPGPERLVAIRTAYIGSA
jgi:hypothetical protein